MQVIRKNLCYFMFLIGMCSAMAPVAATESSAIHTNGIKGRIRQMIEHKKTLRILFVLAMIFLIISLIVSIIMTIIGGIKRKDFAQDSPEYRKYDTMFIASLLSMFVVVGFITVLLSSLIDDMTSVVPTKAGIIAWIKQMTRTQKIINILFVLGVISFIGLFIVVLVLFGPSRSRRIIRK